MYRYPFANWKDLSTAIGMPNDAIAAAAPAAEKLLSEEKFSLIALTEAIREKKDTLSMLQAICDRQNLEHDLGIMTICLLIAPCFREDFAIHGLSEEIYINSMREIYVWSLTCLENRGHWGLYQYDWIHNFLTRDILRLGRLEFHQVIYGGPDWSCGDTTVTRGDRVINIHIPADGPFPIEEVMDAFQRAYTHFGQTGWAVFHCSSWLLYEGNRMFLKPESNICRFMNLFHIIESHGAENCGDLWRIFGVRDSYDPAVLPRHTSLQKALAEHMENGGVMGHGKGFFLFDGKTIR